MSLGGVSSSQGVIRYGVLVDDQATPKINLIKNSFATLGTSSVTLSRNITTLNNSMNTIGTGTSKVSREMTVLNNTFSAGLNPIKNAGNAMNQFNTQQKTLGSQLKTVGSAFKNNALAIGAAASSVLGLYQNYANLSSAQNAANKSATAAKAASLRR